MYKIFDPNIVVRAIFLPNLFFIQATHAWFSQTTVVHFFVELNVFTIWLMLDILVIMH